MRQRSAAPGRESKGISQTVRSDYQRTQQRNNISYARNEAISQSHQQRPTMRKNHNTNLHIEENGIEEETKEDDAITSEVEVHSTVNHTAIRRTLDTQVKLSPADQAFLQDRNILICNPNIRGENQLPQILVGLDHYYDFVHEKGEILQIPSGLRLAGTIFGPTLYGRGSMDAQDSDITAPAIAHCITAVTSAEPENEMLTKLFELEGLGIAPENDEENKDLLPYFNKYSKQMSFDGGFVTAPFLLKDNVIDLADNYSSAIKRLASLHRQPENNLEQKKWYVKILTQYEAEDIIEKAHESIPNSVGLYYMPHSGVWRPQKPKPLRIVFDASSKRKGQLSLNDVTHKGESLIKKIHDILVASRINEIILTCDIEAAFTQIRLQNTHKDLCRFLWLKDPNKPPYRENIVEYRFKRVPFGAKPSPSILKAQVRKRWFWKFAYSLNSKPPLIPFVQE
ncbi:hypothetical protein V3C99_005119 [Haemonchus contortus]|uniref:DUF1758 domain-containing protein n=1 Tax=Haemonchus contortus TaxID=6289 RepID=A0A7I4XU42_HAECO